MGYLYPITNGLGLFNIGTNVSLLFSMQTYSYAVLFIGLIFDVLLLIFVVVSCLLIYSLLLISVETKTFEIGVMRLVGLTKIGFTGMILTQAAMFPTASQRWPITIQIILASLFPDVLTSCICTRTLLLA